MRLQLQSMENGARTLLVFAHPDDESVALGARLGSLPAARLLHITDGAPCNGMDSRAYGFASPGDYAAARQTELECALHIAGAATMPLRCLGIPDQQASLHLADLTRRIAEEVRTHQPEVIVTHPYEGGHPDHDACAFAVHHAVALAAVTPTIIEAAFYHQGPHGIETGCFLPGIGSTGQFYLPLSAAEQERKRAVFGCFKTQRDTLRYFPLDHEVLRPAPMYDFTQPPHAGAPFYDGFPWGMTSGRFCELARIAMDELQMEAAAACR